jgi:ABC-type lipoprotein export system ATPase subunit
MEMSQLEISKKWRHGFDIFKTLTQEFNQTILITHDIDFASKTDRIITMEDA